MKPGIIILLAVLAVIVIGSFIAYNSVEANLKNLTSVPVADVDLSQIADGTYHGSYTAFPVSVEVSVSVENHMIERIDLIKHQNGQGAGAEVIPELVVNSQSLQVDTVSGATYSSKVILKAIENALTSAK